MNINPNQSAFPFVEQVMEPGIQFESVSPGLTIRQEFAARFMAAIIGNTDGLNVVNKMAAKVKQDDAALQLVQVSISLADTLIAELNQTAPATDTGEK